MFACIFRQPPPPFHFLCPSPTQNTCIRKNKRLRLSPQIGTIVPSPLPFGGASSENLARAERKRSLVDELVDDAEATRYAKRKFGDLQGKRGAAGRNTRFGKQRRTKW